MRLAAYVGQSLPVEHMARRSSSGVFNVLHFKSSHQRRRRGSCVDVIRTAQILSATCRLGSHHNQKWTCRNGYIHLQEHNVSLYRSFILNENEVERRREAGDNLKAGASLQERERVGGRRTTDVNKMSRRRRQGLPYLSYSILFPLTVMAFLNKLRCILLKILNETRELSSGR